MVDEAINHDGISTAATVGSKAVKWGIIGAIAAFAIPALIIGGGGFLLGGMVAAGAAAGSGAAITGAIIQGISLLAGVVTGGFAAASYGGTAAVAGGLYGAIRGGDQVSREGRAYRNRGHSHQNSMAKAFNDGEIKGIQEGYQLRGADMEPVIQQRERAAYIRGQKDLIEAAQEEERKASAAQTVKTPGGEVMVRCESKAQVIRKEQEAKDKQSFGPPGPK